MTLMVVLTAEQVGKFIWQDQTTYSHLRPLRLDGNTYALPVAVLDQPEHALWRSIFQRGQIVAASLLTVDSFSSYDYRLAVDGLEMALDIGSTRPNVWQPRPVFTIPSPNLYRFECARNSDRPSADRKNGRRRVELAQVDGDFYFVDGDTVWASWSTVFTNQRAGLDGNNLSIFHQWHQHPDSAISAPPFAMYLDGGTMFIGSRNPSGGTELYSAPAPASWVPVNFVVAVTLGEYGHVDVWIDGEQVVDVDTGVGYYGEGLPYLAYVKSGIYMNNTSTVDVVYHANLEFGLSDLSARVDNPLPLPALRINGWPITAVPYPASNGYPSTALFPQSDQADTMVFPELSLYPSSSSAYPYIAA